MLTRFLTALGLKDLTLKLNSLGCAHCRPLFKQALVDYLHRQDCCDQLCEDCTRRMETNPCACWTASRKNAAASPTRRPACWTTTAPSAKEHFDTVLRLLDAAGVTYEIDHRLVRGLDYYCRTTFEVVSGSISARRPPWPVAAVMTAWSGAWAAPTCPAWALPAAWSAWPSCSGTKKPPRPDFYAVAMDAQSRDLSFGLVQRLRCLGLTGEMNFSDRRFQGPDAPGGQVNARFCCIMGPDEAAAGAVVVKDMDSGEQQTLSLDAAADFLAANSDNGKK